jgi:D-alanyl-D-alanine carboxypeptidase (penicillin-binding protein 5/6)
MHWTKRSCRGRQAAGVAGGLEGDRLADVRRTRQAGHVNELLQGMIIQSGNDASIILAEAVAGSEAAFTERMNLEAKRLGLTNTSFRNSTGLPNPQHYSTARDLAVLATRLITEHPQHYALYSRKEYTYNGITQPNRNRLLFIDPSVDGVKTGHTEAAGFCLIASARREQAGTGLQRRLLSVVLGTASESARPIESQKLLNWGFQGTERSRFRQDQSSGSYRVWKGPRPRSRPASTRTSWCRCHAARQAR